MRELLGQLDGTLRLIATPLDGAGLRLLGALRLRVQDIDLDARLRTIRSGKGDRDHRVLLPEAKRAALADFIQRRLGQHR